MKKIFGTLAILLFLAIGFTSCGKKAHCAAYDSIETEAEETLK